MIYLNKYLTKLSKIKGKLLVPQVGSSKIDYTTLSEITDNKLYDFIVNNNGELLIGRGHYKLNKKQEELYFAGRLKIVSGIITYIDNDSGHYIPSKKELIDFCNAIKPAEYVADDLIIKTMVTNQSVS